MPEHDLTIYEDEKTINYVSFPIYQAHTVGLMLFCVDTGAPYSSMRDIELERIVRHSTRRYIPIIDSEHDFKFADTFVESR